MGLCHQKQIREDPAGRLHRTPDPPRFVTWQYRDNQSATLLLADHPAQPSLRFDEAASYQERRPSREPRPEAPPWNTPLFATARSLGGRTGCGSAVEACAPALPMPDTKRATARPELLRIDIRRNTRVPPAAPKAQGGAGPATGVQRCG